MESIDSSASLKTPIVSSAITEVKTSVALFQWSIKNFSMCQVKLGDCLLSPTFPGGGSITWQIKCFPRGDCERRNNILCIYLELVANNSASQKNSEVPAEFKLSITKAFDKQCHIATSEKVQLYTVGQSWGIELMNREVLLNPKYGYLPNDTLTINCQVTAALRTVVISDVMEAVTSKTMNDQLVEDFGDLLASGSYNDVIFCVSDNQYPAHKAILSARSSAFKALFDDNDLKEESNFIRVEISDVAPAIFEQVLRFIYTGQMGAIQENASAILSAADRYGLFQLKSRCEEILCSQLSIENAVDYLKLADLHSATRLREDAINCINRNAARVTRTDQWKAMVKSQPHLLSDVYEKLIQTQTFLSE